MSLVATDAIILHAFDYSETSRILRLATREVGVVSALARGARRSRTRFGTALDLFAQGAAQLHLKEGRDLQTLAAFDVAHPRATLAEDLGRFAGAAVLAELVLRFATDASQPELFDSLAEALDAVALAPEDRTREASLAGAWRLVSELGFAPAVEVCGTCHSALESGTSLMFSNDAGGVLCTRCARLHPGGRSLPSEARGAIIAWTGGDRVDRLTTPDARAHQRLLREFLQHHLADGRALRAFDSWERGAWTA
ncbi:MAG TPA: DNA repair protein RecO [Gemmatimonadaceae bacterium]|nr:DNA repair protein RecO [Gemmatimonadaceae bacterium]